MLILGVDRGSVDGGTRDYATLARNGCSFAIVRGTYETIADPDARRDRKAIEDAGMVPGEYAFPLPGPAHPSASVQMRRFADVAGELGPGCLPPILDVEFAHGIAATGLSRPQLLAWIREAVEELRKIYGVAPMIYTSARVWDGEDSDSLDADQVLTTEASHDFADCPLWVARYPIGARKSPLANADDLPRPPSPKAWGSDGSWLHQYQGDAVGLLGISSTIDLNRWFPLAFGDIGSRVRWLQDRLGFVELNGDVFDVVTRDAVEAYQVSRGLRPDRVVGPVTFSHLAWERPAVRCIKTS